VQRNNTTLSAPFRGSTTAALCLLWASLASAAPPHSCPEKEGRWDKGRVSLLGIPPFLPPERMELTFAHMAARFSEHLGREVRFGTGTTWRRYSENVRKERYDFALVPWSLYLQLDPGSYLILGRAPGTFRAEFITLKSSPLEQLTDLIGKTLAMAPEGSDIDVLARSTLVDQGLDPDRDVTIRQFDGTLSCLQQILAGTAAACVTLGFARDSFEEKMGVELRVMGETVGVPRSPMVAHRRVPEKERETVRALLMSWAEDPANKLPVSGEQVPSLVPIEAGEYEAVQKLWRSLRER